MPTSNKVLDFLLITMPLYNNILYNLLLQQTAVSKYYLFMNQDIQAYNNAQVEDRRAICELLAREINAGMTGAESKIWHSAPVWFIDGNPIVGYDNLKGGVRLLFWSGQSFDEPELQQEGSFKAAEARYTSPDQVNIDDLARWLEKSKTIQWDYKNIVKHRGVLERIKV